MKLDGICVLDDVLPEDFFELSDGTVVRSLRELVAALEDMSEEDFSLHVYGGQNDFAEWIMEAYWDEDLVGAVLDVKSKRKLVSLLNRVLRKAERKKRAEVRAPVKKRDVLKKIGEMG